MKYYVFDKTGKLLTSYDTRTGAQAYNTTIAPSSNTTSNNTSQSTGSTTTTQGS